MNIGAELRAHNGAIHVSSKKALQGFEAQEIGDAGRQRQKEQKRIASFLMRVIDSPSKQILAQSISLLRLQC